MASSRGPQRVLVACLALLVLGGGLQYWRLRAVNTDLVTQLARLETLLQTAEEKSSKVDRQRQEVGEDLKKTSSRLHELQLEREEEANKCKHLQENLEELEERRKVLENQLESDKEEQDQQLAETAEKIRSLESQVSQLTEQKAAVNADLLKTREELQGVRQAAADHGSCQAQLAQVKSELDQCRAAGAGSQVPAPGSPGGSAGVWPGIRPQSGQLGQQLFEAAEFQQAQGRAGLAAPLQRVLPAPPSQQKTSSKRPRAAGLLQRPPSKETPGAGVLPPPQPPPEPAGAGAGAGSPRRQEQLAPAQAERPGPEQGAAVGLDDVNLQYPNEALKDEAGVDHPDPDAEEEEVKDVALMKGLQELSNKSGKRQDLVGPADNGGDGAVDLDGEPDLGLGPNVPDPLR